MFAVSLVVPLLFQYYVEAGIHSAHEREWLSALYSSSQIVGGVVMGLLSDSGAVSQRTVLQITFAGAAVSYGLIAYGKSISTLMLSRVMVGLIKHSYTVASAMITAVTDASNRSQHIGRLNSAMTVAWILGPSMGALLYQNVGSKSPVILACALFLINLGLVTVLLAQNSGNGRVNNDHGHNSKNNLKGKREGTIWLNLKSCFSSRTLASVVVGKLFVAFVIRATNSQQLGSYYEEMYGLERHQRGYLSSYEKALQFVVQSMLVNRVLHYMGGERRAVLFCAVLLMVRVLAETQQSFWLFLTVLTPVGSLASAMMSVSLQSILSQAAPKTAIFSVYAALDVLQNSVAVLTPFYRTFLFDRMRKSSFAGAMEGDPDPVAFLWVSGLHWGLVVSALAYLLITAWPKERKD